MMCNKFHSKIIQLYPQSASNSPYNIRKNTWQQHDNNNSECFLNKKLAYIKDIQDSIDFSAESNGEKREANCGGSL